jgi:cyanophycin synthetase
MTGGVHPDNLRMAVKATSTLRMELAGIDFITADITRSYFEVDCAILEINTNPHLAWGKREIATQDMIMNAYFPAPERGRIPVVAVLCADDQEPLRHLLASVINAQAQPVVVVNKEGAFIDGSRIVVAKENLSRRIESALSDYAAGSVFSTFSITELLQSGLGVDHIELLVIPAPIHSDDNKMISHILEVAKSIVASAPVITEIAGKVDALPSLWCVGEVSSELPSRQDINRVFRDSDQPKSVAIEQPGKSDQQADTAEDSTDDHLIAVAVVAVLA